MNIDYHSIRAADKERCRTYAQHACSTQEGIEQTFLIALNLILNQVKGCFVECGVAAGAQIMAMTWACTSCHDYRQIHLFDSFQGIPMAGPHDHEQPGLPGAAVDRTLPVEQRLKSSGVSVCSRAQVQAILEQHGFGAYDYVFHEGWFQDTMPDILMPPIAFLRMDGDLYESTECCLKWLYPHLVTGGVALLDDYPLPGSRQAFEDYFIRREEPIPTVVQNVNTGAAWWIKT